MHKIIEIALGVGLGMTIFLVILWILGTCVYVCCGKTKKIATVRKLKTYSGIKVSEIVKDSIEPVSDDTETGEVITETPKND